MSTAFGPAAQTLFEQASLVMPSGVSAGARFNPALGGPLYLSHGRGARIYDVDGNEYLDYNLSHGASLLGHDHPAIREAIGRALDLGVICAYETEHHARFAAMIQQLIPSAERVRFANSGTEATMVALRLARAVTGRRKILKFEGHFHGLHEQILYSAHPPARPRDERQTALTPSPESAGLPEEFGRLVVVVPWNDPEAFARAMAAHGDELAAVILEGIPYNAGCLPPAPGFLEQVRRLTSVHGVVLIFDEVLSGFRTGTGGGQGYYAIRPDLSTFGKAIANGIPIAVIAGRRDLMEQLAPQGQVAHSGTYSGHLFPVLAGIATLTELTRPGFYDRLNALADRLYGGLNEVFADTGVPARVQGLGARFGIHFGLTEPVTTYQQVARGDQVLARAFFRATAARGLYFHDYGHAAGHHGLSSAHTLEDIEATLDRIEDACVKELRADRPVE